MACPCKEELDLYPITIGTIEPEAEPYRECIELAICHLQCILSPVNKEGVIVSDGTITEGLIIDVFREPNPTNAPNALASAGPTEVRANGWQTARGVLNIYDTFSPNVGNDAVSESKCLNILIHEILHIISIVFWDDYNDGTIWTGANATAAFLAAGGSDDLLVDGFHWDETQLGDEIFTPIATSSVWKAPFSTITIGMLEDGGYVVNPNKEEPFQVPNILGTASGQPVYEAIDKFIKITTCDLLSGPSTIFVYPRELVSVGVLPLDFINDLTFNVLSIDSNCVGVNLTSASGPLQLVLDGSGSPGDSCTVRVEVFYQEVSLGISDINVEYCITDNPTLALCVQEPDVTAFGGNVVLTSQAAATLWSEYTTAPYACVTKTEGLTISEGNEGVIVSLIEETGFLTYVAYNDCGQGATSTIVYSTALNHGQAGHPCSLIS